LITIILHALYKLAGITPPEEVDLLARIARRDQQALSELYDRYHRILFKIIVTIVKQTEEAEDVLQEVFTLIWNKAESFDKSKGSAYTWISTLGRNKALDRLRSRSHKQSKQTDYDPDFSILDQTESDIQTPLENTILGERSKLVHLALKEIPIDQQEVIRIAYFEGYSQSEIADRLKLPLGTVKTRMRQGMIKLEASLSTMLEVS